MTTLTRSEYLGVYHNERGDTKFRVAIKKTAKGVSTWYNLGKTNNEKAAARIYNMYAINFFGKGAILNDITMDREALVEFNEFLTDADKPNRMVKLKEAQGRAQAVLAAGNKFRKHTELERNDVMPTLTPVQTDLVHGANIL